jgi:selenocysteine-specific elongation factor
MVELENIYKSAGLEPPATSAAIAAVSRVGISAEITKKLVHMLIERRSLVRINADLMFHGDVIKDLIGRLRGHAALAGENRFIDVGTFKTLAGVSRKYAIPLLEYLDGQGVTRRAGDKRLVL